MRSQPLEESFLGREVGLHGAVVIEVIAGQVAEDANGELDPVAAALVEGDAGDLHGRVRGARPCGLGQVTHERRRCGRGQVGLDPPAEEIVLDSAQQRRRVPGDSQDGAEQKAEGALTIRSGDSHHLETPTALDHVEPIEGRAQPAGGAPSGGKHQSGHVRGQRGRLFADDGRRPCLNRRVHEPVPVQLAAAHGHKAVTRPYGTRVFHHAAHHRIGRAQERPAQARSLQQLRPLHFGFELCHVCVASGHKRCPNRRRGPVRVLTPMRDRSSHLNLA